MGLLNVVTRTFSPMFKSVNRDIGIRGAEPRKGNFQWLAGLPSKKVLKPIVINALTLKQLSNTDPVTWSIKSARKAQVTQTKWDIVRDTEKVELELDRWLSTIVNNMNPWGFEEKFHPIMLSKDLFLKATGDIKNILSMQMVKKEDRKKQLKWYFESLKRKVRQDADEHALIVRRIFEKPNDNENKTFRSFLEMLLDDILTFDAGVIVKNKNYAGELAELYIIPGQEVKIYRNPDRTFPKAPEPAYVWEEQGTLRAEYTKDEICYIMNNPQQNGYGMSPLEVAAYVITASLYAEEYNMDFFKHSNVPPAIFNLGKNITQEQRKNFENNWDNEVAGRGLHRMMFLAGADTPQYIPIRNVNSREMQMMEYLKWTLSIKCACYQISPQDISFVQDFHRSTAQVQKEITKERGIRNLLSLLETNFNTEIIKKEFPWSDVKFQWLGIDLNDDRMQTDIDMQDINNGIICRNDRRKRLGLLPVEGGDTILVNLGAQGIVPIENLVAPDENPAIEQPAEEAMKEQEEAGQPTQLEADNREALQNTKDTMQEEVPQQTKDVAEDKAAIPDEEKAKIVRMIVGFSQQDKINKAMDALKKQGLGDKEIRIALED